MLSVKEVRRVRGIQLHGLETLMWNKGGASPLPDATHLSLATETVAVGRHWNRVPVLKADVGPIQVEEETIGLGRGGCRGCLLDAVVRKVSVC